MSPHSPLEHGRCEQRYCGIPIFFAHLELIKLWVLPLLMRMCKCFPLTSPLTRMVLGVATPVRACNGISGTTLMSVDSSVSISSISSSWSGSISNEKSCFVLHLWPGSNFSSQLKQRPFFPAYLHLSPSQPLQIDTSGWLIGVK